ncbi:hypothetical protein P43SY_000776 [Pythium insidiosum]|uniref:Kinesin motor domain-containing protein n=1 Tax=Pythium insidiosum TaxID=114742 RepID=A0AAD5LYX0_PYTIN|nr:hypothetical protein P43SY_000776 [Pythium insidiosum]
MAARRASVGGGSGSGAGGDAAAPDLLCVTTREPTTPTATARTPESSTTPRSARKDGSVQVAVRIRPQLPKEIASNAPLAVYHEGNTVQVSSSQRSYTFDHVFPSSATQSDLYDHALQPLMESFLQGFNVTVIAYGQTGSGKTYTMGNAAPTTTALTRSISKSKLSPTANFSTKTLVKRLVEELLYQKRLNLVLVNEKEDIMLQPSTDHDKKIAEETEKAFENQLQELKEQHDRELSNMLALIMKLFNEINEFKKKISEFEQNASQKDRLFGSSLRLLEEERFRKMAAKRYPSLLTALRKEVDKWMQNEGGEFNLSILGQEMKALLLEMMNTDTGLMHLDLGVLDASRPTSRKSKPAISISPQLSALTRF